MFDYTKFENDVILDLQNILKIWMKDNDDIYILALDCTRELDSIGAIANTKHFLEEQVDSESEDFWYYKYCEEEWELFENFEKTSSFMNDYLQDNKENFHVINTMSYSEEFDKHCDKVIKSCKNILCRFKQSIEGIFPILLLTFNMRDYIDGEARIEIFREVNSQASVDEYSQHIDDFA